MITSKDNTKVKEWTKLHNKKYRNEEYLILDEEVIKEAFKHNCLKTLIYVSSIPFEFENSFEVSQEVMDKISKKEGLRYIAIGKPIKEEYKPKRRVMILEDLQDPLNIGRIIENATIFGFEQLILSPNCADIYNSKCLEAASNTFFNINIVHMDVKEAINKLKTDGFKVYATGLRDNTKEMYEINPIDKMAFILGNEGSGVNKGTFDISDEVVKIDMLNIDSLNVAMAGSIIMYHFGQ